MARPSCSSTAPAVRSELADPLAGIHHVQPGELVVVQPAVVIGVSMLQPRNRPRPRRVCNLAAGPPRRFRHRPPCRDGHQLDGRSGLIHLRYVHVFARSVPFVTHRPTRSASEAQNRGAVTGRLAPGELMAKPTLSKRRAHPGLFSHASRGANTMKKQLLAGLAATGLALGLAGPASAIDLPAFIGKGDVQTFAGWNNAALQANADKVDFRYVATVTNEWDCVKTVVQGNGVTREIIQERNNVTSTQAAATTVGRLRNQITGFDLTWGSPSTETDGPATGTCPAVPSGFVLDEDSLSSATTGGGLQISLTGHDALGTFVNFS